MPRPTASASNAARAANQHRRNGGLLGQDSTTGTAQQRAHDAAKAFIRMVENGGRGKANQADLVIVCDLRAYRHGHTENGEQCHIIGGGPVPVSLAQELGRDAFLKAVLHDGVAIHSIAHFGRRYPAILRTALTLGAPPDFEGRICSEPGWTGVTTSNEITSTPAPTAAKPPSKTSPPPAGPTTEPKPNETEKPASSTANPEGRTSS